MNMLLVHEWLRTEVVTVNPKLCIERAWKLMERGGFATYQRDRLSPPACEDFQ
jgi:hypothetical protein